jgi:hypothetical protein
MKKYIKQERKRKEEKKKKTWWFSTPHFILWRTHAAERTF